MKEAVRELLNQVKYFLRDTYIKREQSLTFHNFKAAINTVQLEFLENAAIVQENEIQAAQWSHTESSIFPAYVLYRKRCQPECCN